MKLTIDEIKAIIHTGRMRELFNLPKINRNLINGFNVSLQENLKEDKIQLSKRALFERILRKNFTAKPIKVTVNGEDIEWTMFKDSQMGSQDAFWGINNRSGELYYIKYAASAEKEAHLESEMAASKLYKLAKIDSPQMIPITINADKKGIASRFEENLEGVVSARQAAEGFAADAWLANWDSLMPGNTFLKNGKLFKLDNGGALKYRAMGNLKPHFDDNVTELVTLIDGRNCYSKIYASMNKDELIKSFEKVCTITDRAISMTVKNKELAQTLINRKRYMQNVLTEIKKSPEIKEPLDKYFLKIDKIIEEKNLFNPEILIENISKTLTKNIQQSNNGLIFQSTSSLAKNIISEIKALENSGVKISKDELLNFLNDIAEDGIDFGNQEHRKYLFQLMNMDSLYSSLYDNLYYTARTTRIKEGEKISSFLYRIVKARQIRLKQIEHGKIKFIKSQLKYSDKDVVPSKCHLSKDERRLAIEELERERIKDKALDIYAIPKLRKNAGEEEIYRAWQKAHIGGFKFRNSNIQTAVMQLGGRYNSSNAILPNQKFCSWEKHVAKDYVQEFKYEPIYHWIAIPNAEKFVNQIIPKKGEIYSNKEIMCCSSHKHYAEIDFGDHLPEFSVKFIIHPKSETSRAYNLGYNQEVIYDSGEKFRIIDKSKIEYINPITGKSILRWEIHMQELLR